MYSNKKTKIVKKKETEPDIENQLGQHHKPLSKYIKIIIQPGSERVYQEKKENITKKIKNHNTNNDYDYFVDFGGKKMKTRKNKSTKRKNKSTKRKNKSTKRKNKSTKRK